MNERAALAANKLNRAIADSGVAVDTLARATGITSKTIAARLKNRGEWSVADMVRAGGFLRLTPAALLGGNP